MTTLKEKGYAFGRELAIEALNSANQNGRAYRENDVYEGLLTTLIHGLYAINTESEAEEVVSIATASALKAWQEDEENWHNLVANQTIN